MTNRRLIILCILFVLFIMLWYFSKNSYSYVVFNDLSIIKVDKKSYDFINYNKRIFSHKKFDVYDYNQYLGKYNIQLSNNAYIVYDNGNLIKFNSGLVGVYSKNSLVKLNTNNIDSLNDDDIMFLKKVLNDNNISFYGDLSVSEKRLINIGSDSSFYLYNVAFDDFMDDGDSFFSMVYVSDLDSYNIIELNSVSQENLYDLISYYIDAVVDLDGDGVDEIVIDFLSYSQSQNFSKVIYKYRDNAFIAHK